MGFFVWRDDREDEWRDLQDPEEQAPRLDVARLEALGFFDHVPIADRSAVIGLVTASGHPWAERTHRSEHADAEELAERGVRDFLGRLAPFLRRAGVPLEVTYRSARRAALDGRAGGVGRARIGEDGWLDETEAPAYVERLRVALGPAAPLVEVEEVTGASGYGLLLGADVYPVCEPAEGTDPWTQATSATLGLLDHLLTAHGSPERAFALYDGNDLHVVFATNEMARVVNAGVPPRERIRGVGDA